MLKKNLNFVCQCLMDNSDLEMYLNKKSVVTYYISLVLLMNQTNYIQIQEVDVDSTAFGLGSFFYVVRELTKIDRNRPKHNPFTWSNSLFLSVV